MPVNVGVLPIQGVSVGSQKASAVYVGSQQVWSEARIVEWTSPDSVNAQGCGPGYLINIWGVGLLGAQIYFGGVLATTTYNDGNQVAAIVPDNAGDDRGHDTPITATINGIPVAGTLPFVTYEHFAGPVYGGTNLVAPEYSTSYSTRATINLRGCRPGSYLKCDFKFDANILQWVDYQSGIRLYIPRTGEQAGLTQWRRTQTWTGTFSMPLDQHANETVQIQSFVNTGYVECRTLLYCNVNQLTTASDEESLLEDPEQQ